MTDIINYPASLAEDGIVDSNAVRLLGIWREASGQMNSAFKEMMPFLNHFANPERNSGLTDLLLVGDFSYLAMVYGDDWVHSPPSERAKVDEKLMQLVSLNYLSAAQSFTPRLDLILTPIKVPTGGYENTSYFRLIVPVRLKRGAVTLFSYASPITLRQ